MDRGLAENWLSLINNDDQLLLEMAPSITRGEFLIQLNEAITSSK